MNSTVVRLIALFPAALLLIIPPSAAPGDEAPAPTMIGQSINNFKLADPAGKRRALRSLGGKKATVLVFLSFDCPVSAGYSQPLNDLAKEYGTKGVVVAGIVSGRDVEAAEVAKQVREYRVGFPVLLDPQLRGADAVAATTTPEAFLLDGELVLRYRGRIDNGYARRLKSNARVTSQDLRQALDEVLSGKRVSTPVTPAIGCAIDRETKPPAKEGKVTYYRDVLPILRDQCRGCHRPGQIGPFPLISYPQAVHWAADLKEFTQNRQMPPWKPVRGAGFQHERRLSADQLSTLAAWVDGGTPEGNPLDAPRPAAAAGAPNGDPDLVLRLPGAFNLGPTGHDVFRCFVLPTNLREDVFVTAVEIQPGNARIVHHALFFIDTTGQARRLEREAQVREVAELARAGEKMRDFGPGYTTPVGIGFSPSGSLGSWTPNQPLRQLPAGLGYPLPRGADVVVQFHYHRDGRPETDRTTIGLYLARQPVRQRLEELVLDGPLGTVPAGAANIRLRSRFRVHQDLQLHSIRPQLYRLGREVTLTLTPPDGPPQTLLAIDDWDPSWQETYFLKRPLVLKTGSRLTLEVVYDNSSGNPNNPNDPPRAVELGPPASEERCLIYLGLTE